MNSALEPVAYAGSKRSSDRRLHVLLIHQSFASPQEPGGTRHYELARHLVQQGVRVTVVTSEINYLSGHRLSGITGYAGDRECDGIRMVRAYTYPSLHKSLLWSAASFGSFAVTSFIAARKVRDVDVVMGTLPPFFQPWSAWLIARLRGKPFLLEVRDLWLETAIELGAMRNRFFIAFARWLEKRLHRRADAVVINSPGFRDYLERRGVASGKISLIANGVAVEMFGPFVQGESIRREFGLEGKFVVTYAGALGLVNGLEPLLRAAALLQERPEVHLLLVGDGRRREQLQREAEAARLTNVTFAGAQPKERMPAILAASDACIAILRDTPALRTTYPNKVFDYMAAGRPTILAIDGVIRQVIEEAKAGLYVPPTAGAICQAVRALADDPAKARSMGVSARAYVVEHFDRRRQGEKLAELLNALAGRAMPA